MRLVNKKRFITFVAVVVMTIAFAFAVGFATNDTPKIIDYNTHIVTYGDTLWDIAKTSNGYDHMDTREIIYDIQQASGLDVADISCGDVLQIPIYEEE